MNKLTIENVEACIEILCNYIEDNKLQGTSVTNALGELTINNKLWQIQIRLECEDIIDSSGCFESIKIKL